MTTLNDLARAAYERAGVVAPDWDADFVRTVYETSACAVVLALADAVERMLNRLEQEALIRGWVYDPAAEFWQGFDRLRALIAEARALGEGTDR